jgi:hypothetical protein
MNEMLETLGFLVGDWDGQGHGLWSEAFVFSDRLSFLPDAGGRPVMEVREMTIGPDGRSSHSEVGYLISREGGEIVLTIAEPSGITEVLSGGVTSSGVLELESVEIGHAPGTDPVTRVRRRYALAGAELLAEVAIAVGSDELAPHTRSVLRRSEGASRSPRSERTPSY